MSPHRFGPRPPAWLGPDGLPVHWRRAVSRSVAVSMALAIGFPAVWAVVTWLWQGNDWRIAATITALYVPVVVAALAPMRSWARAALTIGSAYGIGVALIAMGRNSFGAGPFFLAVMLASITLGTRWAVVMSVLSAAGLGAAYVATDHQLVLQFPNDDPAVRLRPVIGTLGLCLGLTSALHIVIRSLETSVAAATRLLGELRREAQERVLLARRLVDAEEQERRRIARDLHDDIGQRLTALKLNLQLQRGLQPAAAPPDPCVSIVDDLLRDVRTLSRDLRPALLDEVGLLPAVRALVETQQGAFDVAIDIETELIGLRLPPEVEIACYRALQEALANVVRHARATRITLTAATDAEVLEIALADDGWGFDPGHVASRAAGQHLGLVSMRERMTMIGGRCDVESAPGRGTTVRLSLPLSVVGQAEGPAA
jgi:signal transduction histidine kinase